MPDFDLGATPGTSGVVNVGEWVLVYRFMRQLAGDSKGRDCTYLAMSYCKATEAGEVNADVLLLEPIFKGPQKIPPETIEYVGGKGISAEWLESKQSENGQFNAGGSLAGACAAVAGVTSGTLRVWRREPDDGRGALYEYRRVQETQTERTIVPEPDQTNVVQSFTPVGSEIQVGFRWQTVVLLVIWAFLIGILLGRRVWS